MSPLARALLSGVIAACLTLFLHPDSRPYMTGLVPHPLEAQRIRTVSGAGTGPMAAPASTAEASLWMEMGAARVLNGKKLSTQEIESLLRIAQSAQKSTNPPQFDNAFWPQMEAVFYDQLGDAAKARSAWIQATACTSWHDYQAARLLDEAEKTQNPLAWHFAGLYYERRFAIGAAIVDYGKRALNKTGQTTKSDLEFRFASLLNASLMASGAQSVEILRYANDLSDLTVQPPNSKPLLDNKKWRAIREDERGKFYQALINVGDKPQADDAAGLFSQIDSQLVITQQFRPSENAARISTESIVTAALPDALLIVAILGAIAWPLGIYLLRYSHDHPSFAWLPTVALGLVLGLAVIWLALPPLAGLVALLCSMLLMITPKNERSRLPSDLGPTFTLIVTLLSMMFMFAVVSCISALSTPGKLLLPSILQQSSEVVGSQLALTLVGFAALAFAMVLLAAPMWAFVRRVRTPFVLGLALRTFGLTLLVGGLFGTVVIGPLCVYLDTRAKETLYQIVSNEPRHYTIIFK